MGETVGPCSVGIALGIELGCVLGWKLAAALGWALGTMDSEGSAENEGTPEGAIDRLG